MTLYVKLVNGNPVFGPVDDIKALSLTLHFSEQFGDNLSEI